MFSMVKTVLLSMFKRPSTVSYPQKAKINDPLVRGQVTIAIEACIFCGICGRKCPTNAIEISKAEAFWQIERFNCIQCGCCAEVCPKKCLAMSSELTGASAEQRKDKYSRA
ncbi:MAG: 4Fe-4S binding protein [Oscillospiraceae bacterium]|jgi:formate hydrogenlyase subunit 6/NADH:ubiquinone oxidoreductase subunit I|nr:4Fe-4S binding protein [Oscillospiraceae bacterium]